MARVTTGARSVIFQTKAGYCKRFGDGKVIGPFGTEQEAKDAFPSVKAGSRKKVLK